MLLLQARGGGVHRVSSSEAMASLLARNALARARGAAASLTAVRALSTGVSMQVPGVVNPALLMMINPVSAPTPAFIDPFVRNPIVFEINSSLQITQTPEIAPAMIECPTNAVNEPLLAVKRTYQPSVLRRKRKHGFRSRVVSIGGRKVLKRRFLKGRWRMSL